MEGPRYWLGSSFLHYSYASVAEISSDPDNYTLHCTVTADLSQVPLRPRANASGYGIFYRLEYEIILLFGLEEFEVCVAWEENVRLECLCRHCALKSVL